MTSYYSEALCSARLFIVKNLRLILISTGSNSPLLAANNWNPISVDTP